MEKYPYKPSKEQGKDPVYKIAKGDRDLPRAGIGGKIMIVAFGAIGGGVIGGIITFYMMARASAKHFNPNLDTAYLILGVGALIGAIVGGVGVARLLWKESEG